MNVSSMSGGGDPKTAEATAAAGTRPFFATLLI
jgi:hypothetical protein